MKCKEPMICEANQANTNLCGWMGSSLELDIITVLCRIGKIVRGKQLSDGKHQRRHNFGLYFTNLFVCIYTELNCCAVFAGLAPFKCHVVYSYK